MKNRHPQSAFSLVEVLVAITILLLVVVTPMTLITRVNNSTSFANEQFIAYFLAQEGLELVQKHRDDLFLQHFQNPTGVSDPMHRFKTTANSNPLRWCFSETCGINGTFTPAFRCTGVSNNCRLYASTTPSIGPIQYFHGGSSPISGQKLTPFSRNIKIDRIPPNAGTDVNIKLTEVKVTSTVTWRTGSLIAGQQVQLVTYLANTYDTN